MLADVAADDAIQIGPDAVWTALLRRVAGRALLEGILAVLSRAFRQKRNHGRRIEGWASGSGSTLTFGHRQGVGRRMVSVRGIADFHEGSAGENKQHRRKHGTGNLVELESVHRCRFPLRT